MFNFLKRFLNMDQALHVGQRAGLVREIASGKGGYKKKADRSRGNSGRVKKVPYGKERWGTLGLSDVATAIRKDRCTITISSRKKRRKIAKFSGTPFVAYTIGGAVKGQDPKVAKQIQKANAYKSKISSKVWKRGRAQ